MRSGEEVERAFRRERWNELVLDARRTWGTLLAVAAGLALVILLTASPRHVAGVERGEIVGIQHVQREDGPPDSWLNVRLDSGGYARVYLPRAALYREGARVEVRVIEHAWWPRRRTHELVRYVPEGSDSSRLR